MTKSEQNYRSHPAEYYTICIAFGDRFRKLRVERGLLQRELAIELGFGHHSMCGYENYARIPRPHILVKIAKYFDVSTDYLYGLTDKRKCQ